MQNDIREKLGKEIEAGVTKESQVVYLMAGIRKILEQFDDPTEFGRLKFYCDWALHSRLSKLPAQNVVKILESIYACMAKDEQVPEDSEAMRLVRFDLLKEELSAFLRKLDLKDFTHGTNSWVVFMYLYSRVVEDCPLVTRPNVQIDIRKIAIRVDTAEELIDDHQPFQVNWQFEAREGLILGRYFIICSYSVAKVGRL